MEDRRRENGKCDVGFVWKLCYGLQQRESVEREGSAGGERRGLGCGCRWAVGSVVAGRGRAPCPRASGTQLITCHGSRVMPHVSWVRCA